MKNFNGAKLTLSEKLISTGQRSVLAQLPLLISRSLFPKDVDQSLSARFEKLNDTPSLSTRFSAGFNQPIYLLKREFLTHQLTF